MSTGSGGVRQMVWLLSLKFEFATEVHLNIDVQPDFSVQIKQSFKPEI